MCLSRAFKTEIYFGYNFTEENPSMKYYYESNESHIHPEYHPDYNRRYDIALVKLNKSVTINNEVNNICLPRKWDLGVFFDSSEEGEYVNMGGWGAPTPYLKLAYWRIKEWMPAGPSADVFPIDKLDPCPVR